MRHDFTVVGSGPAGASFAFYASNKGYKVIVYDIHEPGSKPCGWAVPGSIEHFIKIPKEFILTEIKGFRIYLNNQLIKEHSGGHWGYIINKPGFLKYLISSSEFIRKPVRLREDLSPIGVDPREETIIAVGSIGAYGYIHKNGVEVINAVQRILELKEPLDDVNTIEFWFDENLIGYYWVFPRGERVVDIGVGGLESFDKLVYRLEVFTREYLRSVKAEKSSAIKGARIIASNVNKELFMRERSPVVGEAAGFVYPLTGEGIRPSVASSYALFQSIDKGVDRVSVISNIIEWISRQRKLLDRVKAVSPKTRAAVLESIPLDVFTAIGLGELNLKKTLRIITKMPLSVARVLKALL
ncbi:NAD(P)/FAD-dependent oxidoreductase [Pyrofollis japonicus]|uniref:NAD(P)-binding protein n=1 Tax=Pyrofollis japonicus TaxID=3060460 RepID=UPI00295B0C02|nr:NAD(P)/FAD-dependent oxidoreductase [Pyrofollis japonicus]BEP18160.1 NAD(P)/FAD-dependent oxidoreductase [Pyrofollis japonicus]